MKKIFEMPTIECMSILSEKITGEWPEPEFGTSSDPMLPPEN